MQVNKWALGKGGNTVHIYRLHVGIINVFEIGTLVLPHDCMLFSRFTKHFFVSQFMFLDNSIKLF